ncbi:MAG: hypothetical protein JWM98_1491 [Thermoleophilia bacterium]|nr:hypothetical protein [Thermoleophilia bacterium]
MIRPRTFLLVVLAAALAVPAGAAAKGGGSGGGGGTTPAPAPAAPATPCLTLTSLDSGAVVRSPEALRVRATSCSSASQTYALDVVDEATRVLYPTWDCGTTATSLPSLTLAAGASTIFTITTRNGTCAPASAEQHLLTLTATDASGATAATEYVSWSHQVRTESR